MAAALASQAAAADGLEVSDEFSRFLILGGGLAGLSAASYLAKQGVKDFRLLEARNRLGGRVFTVQIGGCKAELGASWIHGVLGNPLYELAASNGLVDMLTVPKPHHVVAVTEDGRRLPFTVLQEIYEAYFWFFKRCEEYFLCKYKPPDGVTSVGQHIELEISIYLQRFPPQQRHVRKLIFDYLLKRECCITGCDTMDEVDLIGIGSYTELPGGNVTLPGGYASLLNPIMAEIPQENIIKGTSVKHIHWRYRAEMEGADPVTAILKQHESSDESDSSVKTVQDASECSSMRSSRAASISCTPAHRRSHPNVLVECEDGTRYYADHVICTIPLGVLKEKKELFVPTMPKEKRDAMDKLNFGTVDKIMLEYERPFLAPDISEVILLWDRPDKELEMKDRWFRRIYSFTKLSETVLVGWIAGEEALYMETLKLNVVAETCTALLKKFLADPYVPKPKSCIFTAWHSLPHSRGSYTSLGVGGQQLHIEKVAEPLYQKPMGRTPVVAFAGEHCHPSFYSTGHGAFLTGRTAAQFFLSAAAAANDDEDVYNLGAASVADLSSWLEEIQLGEKNLADYRAGKVRGGKSKERPSRDGGNLTTPR